MTRDSDSDGLLVGQVWRRLSDGTHVTLVFVDRVWDDVGYRPILGEGKVGRKQECYSTYLKAHYELVSGP